MKTSKRKIYYVYCHKTLDGIVFYIGKGKNNRAWSKFKRNPHWHNKVRKIKYNFLVEIMYSNLTEGTAFKIEMREIKRELDSGTKLTNKTLGGEGQSGLKHTKQTKKKVGLKSKKMWESESFRKTMSEIQRIASKKTWSNQDLRDRHSKQQKLLKGTPEARDSQSLAGGGKPFNVYKLERTPGFFNSTGYVKQVVTKGILIGSWISTKRCADDLKLESSAVYGSLNSKRHYHKGYFFEYSKKVASRRHR